MSFIYAIITLFSKIAYYLNKLGPALRMTQSNPVEKYEKNEEKS